MQKKKKEQKKQSKNSLNVVLAHYYLPISAAVLVLVLFFGYYFILLRHYNSNLISREVDKAAKSNTLELKKKEYAQVTSLIENYEKINREDIENIKYLLPDKKDIPGILVQLEAIAEKNGIILGGITINEVPETANDTFHRLTVNVELIGVSGYSYEIVKSFLSDIENNLRIFDVNAVYFSPESTNYSLNLFTYYYPR